MHQLYGYLRVSSSGQLEGDSLETQARQIQAYAASKVLTVPSENIFIEASVSGVIDFTNRPEGARLLATVNSGDTINFSV